MRRVTSALIIRDTSHVTLIITADQVEKTIFFVQELLTTFRLKRVQRTNNITTNSSIKECKTSTIINSARESVLEFPVVIRNLNSRAIIHMTTVTRVKVLRSWNDSSIERATNEFIVVLNLKHRSSTSSSRKGGSESTSVVQESGSVQE